MMESTCSIDKYGNQIWHLPDSRLLQHRIDGPAYIRTDGYQEWYVNGELHRTDGPAILKQDGSQEWWVHGIQHRSDGPAVAWADGEQEWWVDNVEITDQVTAWMAENNIAWPFDTATQLEFTLRFV